MKSGASHKQGNEHLKTELSTEPVRGDLSVAQTILLILSQSGQATFQEIRNHPKTKILASIRSENSFYTALARLKRRRMIIRTSDGYYEITQSGEYASLKAYVKKETLEMRQDSRSRMSTPRENKWDGKWRLIFFDIPEKQRHIRDYLRRVLKEAGFREFQRSIWVWPYKYPEYIKKLLSDTRIRGQVRAITTLDIDYDADLRRHFKLF